MSFSRVMYGLSVVSISALIFVTGYLVGNRDYVNLQPSTVTVETSDGAIQNSLSRAEYKTIYARSNSAEVFEVGEVGLIVDDSMSQVLVRVVDAPSEFSAAKNIVLPRKYSVLLAYRSADGQSYDTVKVGSINTTADKNNVLSGVFSTNIDLPSFEVRQAERLILMDDSENSSLPEYNTPELPAEYKKNKVPYMWSDKLF